MKNTTKKGGSLLGRKARERQRVPATERVTTRSAPFARTPEVEKKMNVKFPAVEGEQVGRPFRVPGARDILGCATESS